MTKRTKNKTLPHLNNFIKRLHIWSSKIYYDSFSMEKNSDKLDDAIVEKAMYDGRDYYTTIPFWTLDNSLKIKPFIFLGKTKRRRKRR